MYTSDEQLAVAYQYDPLDRLIAANATQRFYKNTRIATEIDGTVKRSFFEYDAQPLAQQQAGTTTLLATDEQTSVLHSISPAQSVPHTYSPYGHRPVENGLLSVLGFNGERPDPLSSYYLLGQGYRAFNPLLMRFNSPDSFSPFGKGGINAYAYCGGDPINKSDPTGQAASLFNILKIPKIAAYKWPTLPIEKIQEIQASQKADTKWVLNKKMSTFPKHLSQTEQKKFDDFQNLIHHSNIDPKSAATLIGGSDYKYIERFGFQLRLSQANRVRLDIIKIKPDADPLTGKPAKNIREVKILTVGGHIPNKK